MKKQYDCNIILDLLPLSIENMVSEETKQVIQQHLLECESCRQAYEDMTRELDITANKKRKKKEKTVSQVSERKLKDPYDYIAKIEKWRKTLTKN